MSIKNHRKRWTKEQTDMLLNSYGETTLKSLAKKLGRSEEAVRVKHYTLTGSGDHKSASGNLTTNMIAEALGVQYRTVCSWVRNSGLIANRYTGKSSGDILIKDKDLWEWMLVNKNRIDFTKCMVGILTPEPKWYKEEIEAAKVKGIEKIKLWTTKEVMLAKELRKEGLTNRQIAEKLNRSYDSVKHKMRVS